jgi:hypothetical protein
LSLTFFFYLRCVFVTLHWAVFNSCMKFIVVVDGMHWHFRCCEIPSHYFTDILHKFKTCTWRRVFIIACFASRFQVKAKYLCIILFLLHKMKDRHVINLRLVKKTDCLYFKVWEYKNWNSLTKRNLSDMVVHAIRFVEYGAIIELLLFLFCNTEWRKCKLLWKRHVSKKMNVFSELLRHLVW